MELFSEPYDLLIIDDQEEIVEITTHYIQSIYGKNKFNIVKTSDPNEALKYLQKIDFHILITDIYMPDIPGDELIRQTLKMNKGTQCVIITGDNMFSTVINAYNDGAIAFMTKPIEKDQLKNAIDLCINRIVFWSKSVTSNIESKKTNSKY